MCLALISKATALRYYDPFLPVTLQVDVSEDAIGGVLIQQDQPVCFTSHTLSNTEKQYAQIEKECLAIVTCMNKWHQYLYGKQHITVHTDHQPLESIFKKPISKAPRRLQRTMLKLLDYQFKLSKLQKGEGTARSRHVITCSAQKTHLNRNNQMFFVWNWWKWI